MLNINRFTPLFDWFYKSIPPNIGTPIVEKIKIINKAQTTIDYFPYLFMNQSAKYWEVNDPKIDHNAIHPV